MWEIEKHYDRKHYFFGQARQQRWWRLRRQIQWQEELDFSFRHLFFAVGGGGDLAMGHNSEFLHS